MRYQRVKWHHDHADEPTVLYSEIGEDGWEVRKVDEYSDGRLDPASTKIEAGSTMLGVQPVPPLEEINADAVFEGAEISPQDFEAVWSRAVRALDSP